MGMLGTGVGLVTSIAHKAADIGSDVLGGAGVGSPGYSMTPTDERAARGNRSNGGAAQAPSQGSSQPEAAPRSNEPPEPPPPPMPGPAPVKPPLGPVAPAGAGAPAAGAGGAEAAAVAL
jgi:hypothetical protein